MEKYPILLPRRNIGTRDEEVLYNGKWYYLHRDVPGRPAESNISDGSQSLSKLEDLVKIVLGRKKWLTRSRVLRGLKEVIDSQSNKSLEEVAWDDLVDSVEDKAGGYKDISVQIDGKIRVFTIHQEDETFQIIFDLLSRELEVPLGDISLTYCGTKIAPSSVSGAFALDKEDIVEYERIVRRPKSPDTIAYEALCRRFITKNILLADLMKSQEVQDFAVRLLTGKENSKRLEVFGHWWNVTRHRQKKRPFSLGPFAANVDMNDDEFEEILRLYKLALTMRIDDRFISVAACHALMPNRSQESYEKLFRILRNAIETDFGDVGVLHTVITDFEAAARQAISQVFRQEAIRVRGCIFHFGQALWRFLRDVGLRTKYETGAKEDPDSQTGPAKFYRWIQSIKSLALCPPELVGRLWYDRLRPPDRQHGLALNNEVRAFRDYFQKTWMKDVEMWNHFDNEWRVCKRLQGQPGPRTTNHAEGWHSKLRSDFGQSHPALNTFLDWLQPTHNVVEIRSRQLFENFRPKMRDARYAKVDRSLNNVKNQLLSALPQNMLLVNVAQHRELFNLHFRRVSYLIGNIDGKKKKEKKTDAAAAAVND